MLGGFLMNIEKLRKFIFETPLAYDDETDSLIGTYDEESQTYWGKLPPTKASVKQIEEFVKQGIEDGIFKDKYLGAGASRIVEANDGKTVFKWNYDTSKFGNQTKYEVETYNKFKNKFGDVIPKIYKYGNHWEVVEKAEPFDDEKFNKLTKMNRIVKGKPEYVWLSFVGMMKDIDETLGYDSVKKLNSYSYANAQNYLKIEADPAIYEEYKPWMHVLLQNPNIYKICCFLIESGVGFSDMHIGNLMFIGDKMVVTDYGVTNKNADIRV